MMEDRFRYKVTLEPHLSYIPFNQLNRINQIVYAESIVVI